MSTEDIDFCPSVLYFDGCTTHGCPLKHDVKLCEPCGLICSPAAVYQSHALTKKHQDLADGRPKSSYLYCPICKVEVVNMNIWQPHIAGARHRKLAASQGLPADVTPITSASVPENVKFCHVCNTQVLKSTWDVHRTTREHRAHEKVATYRAAAEEAERDKQGVEVSPVSGGVDFGVVEIVESERGVSKNLLVKSTRKSSRSTIVQVVVSPKPHSMPCPRGRGRKRSPSRENAAIRVTLRYNERGRFEGYLAIVFQNQSQTRFVIVRELRATIGEAADHQALKADVPYVQPKRVRWRGGQQYFPGRRPPAMDAVPWIKRLRPYRIPEVVASVLRENVPSDAVAQLRAGIWPKTFSAATHGRVFKLLLWIEEYRMERDLRVYDLADVVFTKEGNLYYLVVPGLAEKRPSVVVGDCIEVQPSGSQQGRCFEGWVHVARLNDVGLGFHPSFKPTNGQRFNVRFKLNRIPLRRQHQALGALAKSPGRFLFPTDADIGLKAVPTVSDLSLVPFNPLIADNAEQLQAIRCILRLQKGAAPFIVFGPPGTGKTVTIVETIRQILSRDPQARVLACAPSNSAADILAQRLNSLSSTELFRFYAVSRRRELVPDNLLQHTHTNSQGFFSVPQVSQLAQFRVVVSTCGSASFAFGVGLPPGHFTHIFVDEAAQATEPETMTAMKAMTTPSTQVVLSGDPKQLGPIIRSSVARDLGLGVSYLERMMERDLYDEHRGSGKTLVKLKRNFRSHETILNFSNEQFYGSDLRACGPKRVIDSFVGWKELPNRKFPVIFHAVCGKDEREASSPSYFNTDEILVGKNYIQKLKAERRHVVADEEIGIITPYNAQARKFRDTLKRANVGTGIKVASVEEFQGDERRVIMLTTVRSSKELLTFDAKHTLGFVANPRRLNVAITRAKALLIVIGDPLVLSIDPLWRKFLNYVALNNGWRGIPISWDPHAPVHDGGYENEIRDQGVEDITDFMQRMQSYLGSDDQSAHDFAESQVNAEGVWREPE